jgi:beta-galactosidase
VYISDAIIDRVGIFAENVSAELLKNPSADLKKRAALWLDFEDMTENGEFYSYGIGARTYGAIWPDRRPQPEMWQIKKSGQPVTATPVSPEKGEVEINNRYLFTNLKELQTEWILQGDGETLDHGTLIVDLEPQKKGLVIVPFKKPVINEGVEYRLTMSFRQKEKTMWADPGFEIAWDQMDLPWFRPAGTATAKDGSALTVNEDKDKVVIGGKAFAYIFEKATGALSSMQLNGKEMIKKGAQLNVWHAPLANETDEWGFGYSNHRHMTDGYGLMAATEWYSAGLDKLQRVNEMFNVRKTEDNNVIVEIKNLMVLGTLRGAFMNHFIYTINASGEMSIKHSMVPNGDMPAWLPRVGVDWVLDKSLVNVRWYGRGPQENYPDRKSGYKTGVYKSTVNDMYEPYLIPQDYGLRTDNRWVRITDDKGTGLEFSGDKLFNFSAQPYSTENLTRALYTYQLHPSDGITFNFDYATSGVGCTALSVSSAYQVLPQRYDFTIKVKPIMPRGINAQ